MAQISCTPTSSSISCQLINITANDRFTIYTTRVQWVLSNSMTSWDSFEYTDSTSVGTSFTGLTPGTTYTLSAYLYDRNNNPIYNNNGLQVSYSTTVSTSGSSGGGGGGTTTYPTPSVSIISQTENSITIRISNMSTTMHSIYPWISTTGVSGTWTELSNFAVTFSSSTSTDITITGLSSNTRYYIFVRVYYLGGTQVDSTSVSTTTSSGSTTYPTPTIQVISTTTSSITISVSNMLTSSKNIMSYFRKLGSTSWSEGPYFIPDFNTSRNIEITGLSSNVTYEVCVRIHYLDMAAGTYVESNVQSATTSSSGSVTPTSSIVIDSYTTNSVTFRLCISVSQSSSVSVGYSINDSNGEEVSSNTVTIAAGKTEISVTEDNLEPNTQYTITANAIISGQIIPATAKSFKTLSVSRPATFSWTYTKTQGGTFNLTATEWNNLITNVNAVRTYKGLSTYSCTSATKGATFYYYMYNQLANAINDVYYNSFGSRPISTVSSGDTVTALALNNLVTYINKIT